MVWVKSHIDDLWKEWKKMAQMKRPRLQSIKTLKAKSNPGLRLQFVDGSTYTVDFAPLLAVSKGLAPLRDPAVFAQATLIDGEGWAVVWPEQNIQIGADTLWLDAQAQNPKDRIVCVAPRINSTS